MAGATGLEPATSCVTGRRSNLSEAARAVCKREVGGLKVCSARNTGRFQSFQCTLIAGESWSKLQRPRFAGYQPTTWTEDVDSPVDGNSADSLSSKFRTDLHAVDD